MHWSEVGRFWGTTARERQRGFPCDRLLPDQNDAYFRGVSVFAEPATLFRWLCQMRVAPYSYDWIDNWGQRSPQELTPEVDQLEMGQRFMKIFDLIEFEKNIHITLRLRRPGLFPPLVVSYVIYDEHQAECRLVVKLAVQLRPGRHDGVLAKLGPWLDWIMMRRQLLNLKALAEAHPC